MTDLPKIISDDEFAKLLKHREEAELRSTRDRWDNASLDAPKEPSDGRPESIIEQQFPHVAQNLVAMWPSEACRLYLQKLILNERDIRQGFPPAIIDDLLMLSEINDMLLRFPDPNRKRFHKPPDRNGR